MSKRYTTADLIAMLPVGVTATRLSHGQSYRAGQTLIIHPDGLDPMTTSEAVDIAETDLETFDGTGYDGRGRHGAVVRMTPAPGGLVQGDEPTYSRRGGRVIGGGNGRLYYVPQNAATEELASLADALGSLAETAWGHARWDRVVNLTPHEVHVMPGGGCAGFSYPPSGQVARVAVCYAGAGNGPAGVPLTRGTYGDPEGLPDLRDGVLLIVSGMVRAACPGRPDLASPADLIRDSAGRVIGCRAIEINQATEEAQ